MWLFNWRSWFFDGFWRFFLIFFTFCCWTFWAVFFCFWGEMIHFNSTNQEPKQKEENELFTHLWILSIISYSKIFRINVTSMALLKMELSINFSLFLFSLMFSTCYLKLGSLSYFWILKIFFVKILTKTNFIFHQEQHITWCFIVFSPFLSCLFWNYCCQEIYLWIGCFPIHIQIWKASKQANKYKQEDQKELNF